MNKSKIGIILMAISLLPIGCDNQPKNIMHIEAKVTDLEGNVQIFKQDCKHLKVCPIKFTLSDPNQKGNKQGFNLYVRNFPYGYNEFAALALNITDDSHFDKYMQKISLSDQGHNTFFSDESLFVPRTKKKVKGEVKIRDETGDYATKVADIEIKVW